MLTAEPSYRALIFEGWQFPRLVVEQQAFRKRLFVDELGWHLDHDGEIEIDEFDTDFAVYCSLYLGGEIVASWRAIRTSEEYLGRKIFPQLATLRPYPRHPDIWEISRLGAIRHSQRPLSAHCIYGLMFHFAVSRSALSLCGVVSPLHSRNFERAGIKTRRYGPPQIVGHDAKSRPMSVFFGEIRMSDQQGQALGKMLNPMKQMELQDDALVLGRRAIPA